MSDWLAIINNYISMYDFWIAFLAGSVFGGLPLWLIIEKILEKIENRDCLKFEDVCTLLPSPTDLEWVYLGRKNNPRKGDWDSYPTYRYNNIVVYIGDGVWINDTFVRGSYSYADQVLTGQTSLKMLQQALGDKDA